jgi:hypothetical protein
VAGHLGSISASRPSSKASVAGVTPGCPQTMPSASHSRSSPASAASSSPSRSDDYQWRHAATDALACVEGTVRA